MRVLIFSQYFWPENFYINDVAKKLSEKHVHVEVLTGKPNYPKGVIFEGYKTFGFLREFHDDILIHRIPSIARGSGKLSLAINYLSFVISGLLLSPWVLRKKKYDVIFVYAPSPILQAIPAIFLSWIKKTPVVLWVQDLWPETLSATRYIKSKAALKIVEHVVKFIYRHSSLILVQSQAFIKPVTDLASDIPVKYLPNSIGDIFLYAKTSSTSEGFGINERFSVMFAGNIGSAQAVQVILEAADLLKRNKDIHFFVFGDGSRRKWMLSEAKRRGLDNIYLPGSLSIEFMPQLMQNASVLLATLSDESIFALTVPSKIQAYMAAGRPIIACLNGEGARLVLESRSGLVVPAEDSRGLADAIVEMYRMTSTERELLGANGRNYYQEKFDHDKVINQLIDHFNFSCHKKKETN